MGYLGGHSFTRCPLHTIPTTEFRYHLDFSRYPSPEGNTISGVEAGTPVRAVSWQTIDNHLLIFFAADNEENVHGVMHLYSVNPVQILFLLCDFHKKYILCVLKLAAVSASHCTLVIKAILTNLFTKTLYISNIELYLANF